MSNYYHIFKRLAARLFVIFLALMVGQAAAQTYEAKFDSMNASGWFGGDNRTNIGPRDIGVGQSVLIDTSITIDSFAFHFTNRFDFPQAPDGHGHEVTLTLNVRDDAGTILETVQTVVPDTFAGGWVTWSEIGVDVAAHSTVIFTTYLVGAYDTNQYFTGHSGDQHASYTGGVRYTKGGTSDTEMEDWNGWNIHSWDSAFWLKGTIGAVTSVAETGPALPQTISLGQNYPNPFNPTTSISYSLQEPAVVRLTVFDVLGRQVRTLVNEGRNTGDHSVFWDGRDDAGSAVASGAYFYELRSETFQAARKMLLLQ